MNFCYPALVFLSLFVLPANVLAKKDIAESEPYSSYKCPTQVVLKNFLRFDDLALGENHGTVETPAFIKCLVDYTIENQNERVIVSLEMPSSAREPMSDFWRKSDIEDGRSSVAMKKLVRHLVDLENRLFVDLHFQHRTRFFDTTEDSEYYSKNRVEVIGSEIRKLSKKGKLIVLAGNIHTMKELPKFFVKPVETELALEFEGQYLGASFTHILIEAPHGGSTWSCQPNCGIHNHFIDKNASKGDFIADEYRGHDWIYYLETDGFTASPPSM